MEKVSKIIDWLFKIAIIVVVIFMLKGYLSGSSNGRYQAFLFNGIVNVLDTRTGHIYTGDYDKLAGFYIGKKLIL